MSRGTLRAVSVTLLVGATLFLVFTPLQRTTQAQGGSIFYVGPNGNCGGVLPCFAHPQDAVDAANEGDVIKVVAGIYTGVSARPAPPRYPSPLSALTHLSLSAPIRSAGHIVTLPPASGASR